VISGRYAYVTDTGETMTPSLVGLKIIEILH